MARETCPKCDTQRNAWSFFSFPEVGVICKDCLKKTYGWVSTPEKDISWEHCGRPAYWEQDEVYCSKCQTKLGESN